MITRSAFRAELLRERPVAAAAGYMLHRPRRQPGAPRPGPMYRQGMTPIQSRQPLLMMDPTDPSRDGPTCSPDV